MDDKIVWAIVVAAVTLLIFVAMGIGWRGRHRRTRNLEPYQLLSIDPSTERVFSAFYVATTERDQPLERVNSSGLGFRGRAELRYSSQGLILAIAGSPDFFIPHEQISDAVRATWTIDRVVEPGGLLNIQWSWHELDVDTYLRFPDKDQGNELQRCLSKTETGVSQ